MAYQISWLDEQQTLLYIEVLGESSWAEFHDMNQVMIEHIQRAPGRLDIITHIKGKQIPSGNPLPHLETGRRRMSAVEPKGMFIIVNPSVSASFFQNLMNTISKAAKLNIAPKNVFVKTLDQALQQINADRAAGGIPPVNAALAS